MSISTVWPQGIRNPGRVHQDPIEPDQVGTWMKNLHILWENVTLFPDPYQAIFRGSKLATIQSLAHIAKTVTNTDYPQVVTVNNIEDEDTLKNNNVVFKRGYSDSSLLVWKGGVKGVEEVKQLVEVQKKYYQHDSLREIGVIPRWFAVPYIADIVSKGEIRCFFIGGHLRYKIWTMPENNHLLVKEVQEMTPLSNLLWVPRHLHLVGPSIGIICSRKKGVPSTSKTSPYLNDSPLGSNLQSLGTQQFEAFLKKTFYGLIHQEEQILPKGQLSDLRAFCRLDASVFMHRSGSYKYFVNEVEASHGTNLFLDYIHFKGPRIVTDLAVALRVKVAIRRAQQAELAG